MGQSMEGGLPCSFLSSLLSGWNKPLPFRVEPWRRLKASLMHKGKAMAGNAENNGGWRGSRWRIAFWTVAALILLLPLVAMQFTDEIVWDVADFAFAGALLVGVGVAFELAVRMTGNRAYRAAVSVALAAAFLLIWVNAAVGIIGSENNDANLMFGGVLAAGIFGALIARFQPHRMACALVATALAQMLVSVIALIAGLGSPSSGPEEIFFLNGFFAALWLTSAGLFRKAARGGTVNIHKLLSLLTIGVGFYFMMGMIFIEDEPGGIPLLLILLGTGWYIITRIRTRSHPR